MEGTALAYRNGLRSGEAEIGTGQKSNQRKGRHESAGGSEVAAKMNAQEKKWQAKLRQSLSDQELFEVIREIGQSITKKWNERGGFIRHINGNTLDNRPDNLARVSLHEWLENFENWQVDWDLDLTETEIRLVLKPEWRSGLKEEGK
jgi:hypothetical protein